MSAPAELVAFDDNVPVSAPRLFVPDASVHGRLVRLPDDEAHHVTRVLRLGEGDEVRVFDGRGREWSARLAASDRKRADVLIEREVSPVPEPPVRIALAVGLLKGDQMDAVVRDATALGAWSIVPVISAHVAVPERAWRSGRARDRWRRVAVAAAKQCGRAVVPEIEQVVPFAAALERTRVAWSAICVEPRAGAPEVNTVPAGRARPTEAFVLVGPEGGWSPDEVGQARAAGAAPLQFGPRTVRAELMPAVVLTALWTVWGW